MQVAPNLKNIGAEKESIMTVKEMSTCGKGGSENGNDSLQITLLGREKLVKAKVKSVGFLGHTAALGREEAQ